MCFTASIGVVVNIVLAYVLGGHHYGQPKDEVRHSAVEEGNAKIRTETNINLRTAALYVLGDLLAAVGVLVSSIILIFKPEITFVDPMCTFLFSILVLYTTYHLVKYSLTPLSRLSLTSLTSPATVDQSCVHQDIKNSYISITLLNILKNILYLL